MDYVLDSSAGQLAFLWAFILVRTSQPAPRLAVNLERPFSRTFLARLNLPSPARIYICRREQRGVHQGAPFPNPLSLVLQPGAKGRFSTEQVNGLSGTRSPLDRRFQSSLANSPFTYRIHFCKRPAVP